MQYDIFFEIYGKKMKCTLFAESKEQAEYILRGKIKIHKICEQPTPQTKGDFFDNFKDILGV